MLIIQSVKMFSDTVGFAFYRLKCMYYHKCTYKKNQV